MRRLVPGTLLGSCGGAMGGRQLMTPSQLLELIPLRDRYAVCRLPTDAAIPAWAMASDFLSVTRTPDEVSLVCREDRVPAGIRSERGWRCLRVAGTLEYGQVGILASLVGPLVEAGLSLFVISTFDTDYVLVKEVDLGRAVEAWRRAGHELCQ